MRALNLLFVASMPVLKVLLLTALGLLFAVHHVDVLGTNARKHLNKLVYFVFNPALVGSNLAQTVTFESLRTLWFMPVNVLATNIVGSALGWILMKATKSAKHLNGLIIGSCSSGNLGNLPIIMIPALCKEKGTPFGDANVCHSNGMAYASLSMALGNLFCWSYAYNIVRISCMKFMEKQVISDYQLDAETTVTLLASSYSSLNSISSQNQIPIALPWAWGGGGGGWSYTIKQWFITGSFNYCSGMSSNSLVHHSIPHLIPNQTLLVTHGYMMICMQIIGFMIGTIPLIRNLVVGNEATFHVVQDSIYMLGEAAVPAMTLILGASIKGSSIEVGLVMGVVAVRYIFLPLMGILIIKGALYFNIIPFDSLFVFVLLLQYAVPPAMNISTIIEMFGTCESEASVIMLGTYALAPIALTLWSTLFLWFVAS